MTDQFNCPTCGAHDFGLTAPDCRWCLKKELAAARAELEHQTYAYSREFERAEKAEADLTRHMQIATDALAEAERNREDAERYRWLRKQSVPEFQRLYIVNIKDGYPFDELVDAARKAG